MSGKALDQSVFDGAPDWVGFVTISSSGSMVFWENEPFLKPHGWDVVDVDSQILVVRTGGNGGVWQNKKLKRELPNENDFDVKDLVEKFSKNPPNFDRLMRSVAAAQNPPQVRFKKLRPDAKIPVRAGKHRTAGKGKRR